MVTPGSLQVTYKGEAGFDTANSYDFVGDDREDATETIAITAVSTTRMVQEKCPESVRYQSL